MNNSELHKTLRLEIMLKGNSFDGILNLGGVSVQHGEQTPYLLDSLNSSGKPVLVNGEEFYVIHSEFETYENTSKDFSTDNGYDLEQNLLSLLSNNPKVTTNLYYCAGEDEEQAMTHNIERIAHMKLIDLSDLGFSIPVTQDDDL